MTPHRLERRLRIPLPRRQVFDFFCDAGNLERITPPELRFRILTPPPIAMEEGARIEYQLTLFAIPFRWKTRIAQWDPPFSFVDRQEQGPYALWVHAHEFEEVGQETEMLDRVEYRLPLEPLGRLALPLVRRQLDRIFDYRQSAVVQILGGRL